MLQTSNINQLQQGSIRLPQLIDPNAIENRSFPKSNLFCLGRRRSPVQIWVPRPLQPGILSNSTKLWFFQVNPQRVKYIAEQVSKNMFGTSPQIANLDASVCLFILGRISRVSSRFWRFWAAAAVSERGRDPLPHPLLRYLLSEL